MTIRNLPNEIAFLKDDDVITVNYRVGDLRRAIEMGSGGPEIMSTAQAAEVFGWTSKRWRNWAEHRQVEGAWQEEDGRWRLPRESCRQWVDELRTRGQRPPKLHYTLERRIPSGAAAPRSRIPENTINPSRKSIRRGPRKAEAR